LARLVDDATVMGDTTDTAATDTVMAADTGRADTDADAATMVTTEEAAHLARVSVRTVRRWIQHGHLPHIETENGKLVSPADLPAARRRASSGRGHGHGQPGRGHVSGHDRLDTARDTDTRTVAVPPGAAAQLEAIRDEWLQPLVTRIEELSRENGRLESERDRARREGDDLRAALEQARAELAAAGHPPTAPPDAPGSPEGAGPDSSPPQPDPRPWWRRLFGG
jgi:excisionase family DNA binding protein